MFTDDHDIKSETLKPLKSSLRPRTRVYEPGERMNNINCLLEIVLRSQNIHHKPLFSSLQTMNFCIWEWTLKRSTNWLSPCGIQRGPCLMDVDRAAHLEPPCRCAAALPRDSLVMESKTWLRVLCVQFQYNLLSARTCTDSHRWPWTASCRPSSWPGGQMPRGISKCLFPALACGLHCFYSQRNSNHGRGS